MKKSLKTKILCAMSGGLDSSLAAFFLKESKTFQVEGVFLRLCPEKGPQSFRPEKTASLIASKLGIPFTVLDFQEEFQERIVNKFLTDYQRGTTPNPCVFCNEEIKFGLLQKEMKRRKIKLMATGHHARLREEKGRVHLLRGRDKKKDQSYFLWRLSQKQLERTLFPVGGYKKKEIKKIAQGLNLPLSKMKESQDVCFITGKTSDFLKKHLQTEPGEIVTSQGETVGKHKGLWFYTIGQRKGLNLSGGPFYALRKERKSNVLVVTREEKELFEKEAVLKDLNWISDQEPRLPLEIKAKIRYRHQAARATLVRKPNSQFYQLKFQQPQRAIAPGQSAVFYKGEEVLGGGIICSNH